jgi:hypothetical protein
VILQESVINLIDVRKVVHWLAVLVLVVHSQLIVKDRM